MRFRPENTNFGASDAVWVRSRTRAIAPRKHLRVLPTRTRPNLFGD